VGNEKGVHNYGWKIGWEGVNWFHLAKVRDQWWAVWNIKAKTKAVPLHAMKALARRGGIAPTHS
jgi:hypothetical protein